MSAAPSSDAEDPVDAEIKKFRNKMECYVGVFDEMVKEYKGLDELNIEFKGHVEETNLQLDQCVRAESPNSKKR